MLAGRGFIVWGVGIVVILGLFLIFVAAGWPGTPNDCIYDRPDTCFCERFDPRQVEAGAPGVRQPVNTWFNLYSILTSLAVALVVYFDRKSSGSGRARNVIRSSTAVPDLYIFAVLFLGLGSMWFHGSLTVWGGIFDGVSMYVYAAFLIFYSVRRFWDSALFFWIGYLATVALFSFLHTVLPSVVNIMILVAAYLGIEIYIWVRTRKVMQGKPVTIALWVAAVVAILAATFFWWASHTGNFLCSPTSAFQSHGLLQSVMPFTYVVDPAFDAPGCRPRARCSTPVAPGESVEYVHFMSWSERKSEQFKALRLAEARGPLTEKERVVLEELLADLDAEEAEALRFADERLDAQVRAMDAEKAELDLKAGELERIAREEEALLVEAQAYAARLRQRSAALAEDFWRVMGRSLAPSR